MKEFKGKEDILKIKAAGLPSPTRLYSDLYPYAPKQQMGAVTPSNYSLGKIGHWGKFHLNNARRIRVVKKFRLNLRVDCKG